MSSETPTENKSPAAEFEREVKDGERFQFGRNWAAFLSTLTEERMAVATQSLQQMLGVEQLSGTRFLDIGSGSGLFSLAARRLGAVVHSFDYDPQSVACTEELRKKYFPDDGDWTIEQGSVLDKGYVESLGAFDTTYAWGVLHHTGDMWAALENAAIPVKPGGSLYVAIYNDQGYKSRFWRRVKRLYCSGLPGRWSVLSVFFPYFFMVTLRDCLLTRKNLFTGYKQVRGMSITHDWRDWLGGYPFEVAKIEDIFTFYRQRNFTLTNIISSIGLGNNRFVFKREDDEK